MKKILPSGQKTLFDEKPIINAIDAKVSSTFQDNLSLPIHRWFRYSAGFSALWVRKLLEQEKLKGRERIVDPFVGSGTVLLEAEQCGLESIGIEAHPFISRIANAKLCWRENLDDFYDHAMSILNWAKDHDASPRQHSTLIQKCYGHKSLSRLDSLLEAWNRKSDGSEISELTWLAFVSIARACSHAGTAQWQYVLPKKTKARVVDPYDAFENKILLMKRDMHYRQMRSGGSRAIVNHDDARSCLSVRDGWADLVLTSPPYANNYDYADATRLEMSLLGDIEGWSDLQNSVRKYLVCSCTQHVSKTSNDIEMMLQDKLLHPIKDEIIEACDNLKQERGKHGGKKPYDAMIAGYFIDMAKIWKALRRISKKESLVCFVIGDSAPYGVHVPVEEWLGKLALSSGFGSYYFEKTRDRNVKWKNRKHRVPLHEGRLWVNG